MRHRKAGRHLGRTPSHRRALHRNMAASLIQHGAIRTTGPKAKELRRFVERLITIARKGTLHARRQVIALLGDRRMFNAEGEADENTVVQKLFKEIAPRFADRPGGYTRIIRLSERRIGDAGSQVLLQLLGDEPAAAGTEPAKTSRRGMRAAKRREAAGLGAGEEDRAEAEGPPDEGETDDRSEEADEGTRPDRPDAPAEEDAPKEEPAK